MENNTIKVALGKVLQIRKRLVGRLDRIETDIQTYNSTLEEQSGKVDIRKLLNLRTDIKTALLELKNALYKGNTKIQPKLYELVEKKGDIVFYGAINTHDGKERHGYQNTEVLYRAIIKKDEVDTAIKRLEAECDILQDEINVYNYSTKIEIPQIVLDLAS
jgi:hypothetical protein